MMRQFRFAKVVVGGEPAVQRWVTVELGPLGVPPTFGVTVRWAPPWRDTGRALEDKLVFQKWNDRWRRTRGDFTAGHAEVLERARRLDMGTFPRPLP